MFKKLLEKIKEKKYYLIITVLFFVFLIFMNQPFDTAKYKYTFENAEELVGQTDFLLAENKVSQTFTAKRDGLVEIGIKTVTQDRKINSKVNIEIKEIEAQKTIFNKEVSLLEAKNDSYFEIEIDRQKDSKNKEYELIITSLDAVKENATMFALATNDEASGEIYKYNNEEIKDNKIMIFTEYYSPQSGVYNILLWFLVLVLALVFVLFGLDAANEKTFLKFAICFAILYVFISPFPHYLDEGAHFFRAVLISQGDFYHSIDENGEIGGYVSENFLGYVLQGVTAKRFSNNTLPTGDLFSGNEIFNPFKYFSSTIPLGHMISAIALVFGNILNLNTYLTIYLSRLFPYIFYVVCTYFAIKNLKHYKSVLFMVATLPIALYVGGSVSLDPIINGSAFLFISICLKYYFEAEEETYITKTDIALLIITAIFIITIKYLTYTPLILLFFLIPKKKFKTNKSYITMIAAAVIIGLLCVLWQFYMLNAFPYEEDRSGYINQEEQLHFILGHPIFVLRKLIIQCMGLSKIHTGIYTPQPLGVIPDLTGVVLVIGAILEKNKFNKEKRKKYLSVALITIFVLALLLANLALYLSFTSVGDDQIVGYQIRYHVPILMLILIPIANCFNLKNETKDYEKKVAFFMFILNIDAILSVLIEVFSRP